MFPLRYDPALGQSAAWPRTLASISGALVAATGAFVLAGWSLHAEWLITALPGGRAMAPLTAFALFLLGGGILLLAWISKGKVLPAHDSGNAVIARCVALVRGIAGLVMALGAARLFVLQPDKTSAFDMLGIFNPGDLAPAMALFGAANCMLLGLALWLSTQTTFSRWLPVLVLLALTIGGLGFMRNLYGGRPLLPHAEMAVHTTVAYMLASVGILSLRPDGGLMRLLASDTAGGAMARRLLPSGLVLPTFLGWLRLKGEQAGFYDTVGGLSLFALSNVVVFGLLAWHTAEHLHHTDLKSHRAESELQTSTQQIANLRDALDQHAIVAITDVRGRITFANDKFCAISKYSQEELRGQDHRILNSGYHPKEFFRDLWTTIAHGKVWTGNIKNRAKDGSYYWVATTIVPFRDAHGKPQQYVAIRADITEQKRIEEALRESEARLQTVIENLSEGLVLSEIDGKLVHWNRAGLEMHGFTSIDEVSRKIPEFGSIFELATLDGHVLPTSEWPLSRIIRGETVRDCELRIRRLDSVWERIFSYGGSIVRDGTGRSLAFVSITDITERKRGEAAIRARELAEAANRLKSEFLANMSHELRTPLNGIIGFTEFLVDGKPGALNPKQREYLGDILSSGRHLLQLINDILDLSKIEAGRTELYPEVFKVRDIIDEVCAGAAPLAEKKRIALVREVDPALGEVKLDPQRFKQVLYNLVSNAVKFTNDGGRVAVCATPIDGNRFTVAVQDSGIGIKPADLARLFKEFEQLESGAARRYEGTGLGLALTKRLLEMHGGHIEVQSTVGVGSTFIATLPRALKEAA